MSYKDIATQFLTMIISGQVQEAFDQHTGEPFVHHNQYTKPGKQALIDGMKGNNDNFPNKTLAIDMIIAEADRLMTYSLLKFTPEHLGIRVVHILRFENDKIVEMRDVGQQVEESSPNKS